MAERIGSVCTINDKDVYTLFNADLKELIPAAGSITVDFSKALGASSLQVVNHKFETGGINAIFYVGGATKEECYVNTSNLIAECQNCIIKTDEDRFEYAAVLTTYNVVETGVEYFNEVNLTFGVIKRLPMVTNTFTSGRGTFQNTGSVESGMRITITPNVALTTITVNGITIKNLTRNNPFVIDGLVGEVMCNGVNRFLDTDLIEFPKVLPGSNTVEASNTSVTIEVAYYPTFIV